MLIKHLRLLFASGGGEFPVPHYVRGAKDALGEEGENLLKAELQARGDKTLFLVSAGSQDTPQA